MQYTITKKLLCAFGLACGVLGAQRADAIFVPVPLTGFTQDVIANGVGLPTTSTTSAFDNTAFCLVAQNYKASATGPSPTAFLPNSGTINSVATTGLSFQLADYSTENSLRLVANGSSGTLVFATNYIGTVYVLGATGDGASTATITVNFTDNTSQSFTGQAFPDWFNGTGFAIQGIGRVGRTNGALEAPSGNPRLYQKQLTLSAANLSKIIASVTVTKTTAAGWLNILAVSVDAQCISAQNLIAYNITSTGANLMWNASATAASGYEWAITATATPPATGTVTTATTATSGVLTPATNYFAHVRSKCSGTSNSAWVTRAFTTPASSTCANPGQPVVSNLTSTGATYTWTAGAGAVDYEYLVNNIPTPPATNGITTTALTASSTTLTPGTVYYIHVRANCGATLSNWVTNTFLTPLPPCFAPTVTATNLNINGAQINWNSTTNGLSYQYAVNTSATPPASGTQTTDTVYIATGLLANTTYRAHVRSRCGGPANFSPWTTITFTTTTTCSIPDTIIFSNLTPTSVFIEWNPLAGAAGYEYVVNNSPGAPTGNGNFVTFNAIAPLNLNSNTQYYVHVRTSCGTAGFSPWKSASFTTPPNCVATSQFSVTNITPTQATLSWNPVSAASGYEYAVTLTSTPPVSSNVTTAFSELATGLTPSTPYFAHVRSRCGSNDVSPWTTRAFTTLSPTGVNNVNANAVQLVAHPNPVQHTLTLQITGPANINGQVQVIDVVGKMVRQQVVSAGKTEIDMSSLPTGMYLVKYTDKENSQVVKVYKQ